MSENTGVEADASDSEKAVYRVRIEAPIETVWSTLVKTDEVLPFFFGAVCRSTGGLTPGRPMRMESKDGRYASVVGKVLEFDPPRRYAHTMKFTSMPDAPVTVVYDLKDLGGATEFTLTTLGAVPGSKTATSMARGGPYIVKTLKEVVETGHAALSTRAMLAMFSLLAFTTPAVSKSENWSDDTILNL